MAQRSDRSFQFKFLDALISAPFLIAMVLLTPLLTITPFLALPLDLLMISLCFIALSAVLIYAAIHSPKEQASTMENFPIDDTFTPGAYSIEIHPHSIHRARAHVHPSFIPRTQERFHPQHSHIHFLHAAHPGVAPERHVSERTEHRHPSRQF